MALVLSEQIHQILTAAGWTGTGGRLTPSAREYIESAGFPLGGIGEEILDQFSGIQIPERFGRHFVFDGCAVATMFEPEELPFVRALAPVPLYPVSWFDSMVYFVRSDGKWVILHDVWSGYWLAHSTDDAIRFISNLTVAEEMKFHYLKKEQCPGSV